MKTHSIVSIIYKTNGFSLQNLQIHGHHLCLDLVIVGSYKQKGSLKYISTIQYMTIKLLKLNPVTQADSTML